MSIPKELLADLDKLRSDLEALYAAPPIVITPRESDPATVVTGFGTTFGLDYRTGGADSGDDGVGAWGAHTANKEILGVSLPEAVMIQSFGFSGTWAQTKGKIGEYLATNKTQVAVTRNGVTILADVVDAGPARTYRGELLHNAIDLTWALSHKLSTNGRAIVSYQILDRGGVPIVIKGWDRVNGCEILMPGVA